MKATFTPGPWQVTQMPDGSIEITRKAGCHIAVMLYTGYPGQVKNNAQLIAAAPDLLAALESVTLAIEQLVDIKQGSPVAFSVRKARAAIAKAMGVS